MGALPCEIVRGAPPDCVIGRAGIRKHRDRLVRPYAVAEKLVPPLVHIGRVVVHGVHEVGLHERNPFEFLRHNESPREFARGEAAFFIQPRPASLGNTFHTRLD